MKEIRLLIALFSALVLLFPLAAAGPAGGGDVRVTELSHGAVTMLSMTSDGSFVAAGTQDGTVVLLNRGGGAVWNYYNTKSNSRNAVVAIHPLGTYVLGATGTAVYAISNAGSELWSDPRQHMTNVYDVALSTDGFGYTTAGNSLYFFEKDGAPLFSLKTASAVWRFAISSDGAYIATGTSDPDHKVYLFDRNQSLRWTYDPKSPVSDVDLSYRALRVAAGAGQTLYLFGQNGALIGAYDCGSQVNGVSISRDGSRIAVGTQDGSVRIISETGEVLWKRQTTGRVYDVAFSSDGTSLAAGVDTAVQWFTPDIPAMTPTYAGAVLGAPGTGSLIAASVPAGATVFIDTTYRGVSPAVITDLAPGSHTLLLRQAGYQDWSATVMVLPDVAIRLTGTLVPVSPPATQSPAPLAGLLGALALAGAVVALRSRRR